MTDYSENEFEDVDLTLVDDNTSEYLTEPGSYDMYIYSVKAHTAQTGSKAARFGLMTIDRRKNIVDCYLAPNALWKLKQLAEACGLPEAEMSSFNPRLLIGACVTVTFEKPDKYLVAKSFRQCMPFEPLPKVETAQAQEPDIPF